MPSFRAKERLRGLYQIEQPLPITGRRGLETAGIAAVEHWGRNRRGAVVAWSDVRLPFIACS
jgi:hypothetical protein